MTDSRRTAHRGGAAPADVSRLPEFVRGQMTLGKVARFLQGAVLAPLTLPFYGAAYEPSADRRIESMVDLAGLAPGARVADLGSGDGRVLLEFARRGIEAHGFEINPVLVAMSRRHIRRAGMASLASAHWGNFWRQPLDEFDAVVTFQVFWVMKRLEKKLARELRPGARFVSNRWPLSSWQPVEERDEVYAYQSPR